MSHAPRRRVDALVIGAGAAGLAAARTLSHEGKTAVVIEARNRIGGRIRTIHDGTGGLPVELGAEFVHGESDETFGIVRAAGLLVDLIPDDHLKARNGKLVPIPNFWPKLSAAGEDFARRARRTRGGDRSFAEALERSSLATETRELLLDFVQGYHAADPHKISAAFFAADEEADQEGASPKQFRLANGNDALVEWLRAGLDPERIEVRLNTVAARIRWKRGQVHLWCETRAGARLDPFRARAAVVAVPHAVLKTGAIRFDPDLPGKRRAIERLEPGQVFKIVLQFREAFWEEDDFVRTRLERDRADRAELNFVHAHDEAVPTWWTSLPARAPRLTGWAGGPRADSILREEESVRVDRSLTALARALAVPRPQLDDLLDAWWTHDWAADPFSRGAYTYPRVGAGRAQKELARPVEGTLFFAGEATERDQAATVAGAIASGRRAAREALRLLSR